MWLGDRVTDAKASGVFSFRVSPPVPTSIQFVHPLLRARDWQDRPQLDQVCRWWPTGGAGVCALIGIGGAGKTAITDRLLQVLPGALPPHPDVPKRPDLRPPQRLFVFSFYAAPNPDSFFAALGDFLGCRAGPAESHAIAETQRPILR